MFRHYLLTSIRTLRQNPLYTALSVFGIALTFVFVCILLLIAKSVNGDYVPSKYAERTWIISRIQQENKYRFITKEQIEAWIPKMKTPETTLVSTFEMVETVIMNERSVAIFILGVGDNYFDIHRLKFLRGRPINGQEIADNIPVAVIAKDIANMYLGKNEDPIGKSIELNGIQYRVVGVVENASLFNMSNGISFANMWIPIGTAKVVNRSEIWYNISFTAKNEAAIPDMQAEFTRVINEANTDEDVRYSIPNWQQKSLSESDVFGGSGNMISIVGCLILMLIPAFNILSLNVSKSHDRNEEIAVRKAFGAPMPTIFGQLLLENTLITLAGAVVGMCVTPLLLNAIDRMIPSSIIPMSLSLHFDWITIFLVACPCVLLFSFLSGSIPAWITAKRNIVNVLKGEVQ